MGFYTCQKTKKRVFGGRLRTLYGKDGPVQWFINDVEVTKAEADEAFPPRLDVTVGEGVPDGLRPGIWPMYSEALAVHPSQVDEANDRARKAGIGARYQKGTGVCEIDSDGDKVKLVKMEGFVNKQAGYR